MKILPPPQHSLCDRLAHELTEWNRFLDAELTLGFDLTPSEVDQLQADSKPWLNVRIAPPFHTDAYVCVEGSHPIPETWSLPSLSHGKARPQSNLKHCKQSILLIGLPGNSPRRAWFQSDPQWKERTPQLERFVANFDHVWLSMVPNPERELVHFGRILGMETTWAPAVLAAESPNFTHLATVDPDWQFFARGIGKPWEPLAPATHCSSTLLAARSLFNPEFWNTWLKP